MIEAIVAAFCGAGEDISGKILLGKMKIPLKVYLPFVFAFLIIISIFAAPIGFHVAPGALSFKVILLFFLMTAISFTWNILFAKSLQSEPLHEYELIVLTSPLLTVIVATIFLPSERNIHVFVAALIASLAVLWARFRRHHFEISKSAKRTFLAVFLIAFESVILKELFTYFSPALLYFLRVIVLAVAFFYFYKPDFAVLSYKPAWRWLLVSALIGTVMMVSKYSAFAHFGVVKTTIILLLGPLITYAVSYFYFKEARNFKRDLIAASIVVLCIIYATVVK